MRLLPLTGHRVEADAASRDLSGWRRRLIVKEPSAAKNDCPFSIRQQRNVLQHRDCKSLPSYIAL